VETVRTEDVHRASGARIIVNRNLCVSTAACVSTSPRAFELDPKQVVVDGLYAAFDAGRDVVTCVV